MDSRLPKILTLFAPWWEGPNKIMIANLEDTRIGPMWQEVQECQIKLSASILLRDAQGIEIIWEARALS